MKVEKKDLKGLSRKDQQKELARMEKEKEAIQQEIKVKKLLNKLFDRMYVPLADGKGRREDGQWILEQGCNVYCGMLRDELTNKRFVSFLWQKHMESKGVTSSDSVASGNELRNFMRAFDESISRDDIEKLCLTYKARQVESPTSEPKLDM
jgi:hypothetical protein